MGLSRTWRLLVVVALLFAQQAALAHQVWHSAAKSKPAAEQGKKTNPLCEQHEALGTVLGALSGAALHSPAIEPAAIHFSAAAVPAARISLLSPVSRGPPAPV